MPGQPQQGQLLTLRPFDSAILGYSRKVHIYLPPGYRRDGEPYPVLYAHDGQNVFHTAFNGQSWRLQDACDRLIAEERIEAPIIVAVDNAGEQRSSEFAHGGPHESKLDYPCKGELYERFLIEELKPYIDSLFHTRRDSDGTILLGSSRGGLVTFHIGFRRPDIFGKVAIVSPYFAQYNEEQLSHHSIVTLPRQKGPRKVWIDAGGMEGMTLQQQHVREVVDHLLELGYRSGEDLAYYYDPLAVHNEEAWSQRVHAPLLYLLGQETLGPAVALELHGPAEIGKTGPTAYLNPVARFASGLVLTDLAADLRLQPTALGTVASTSGDNTAPTGLDAVTPTALGTVTPTGVVQPLAAGEVDLIYRRDGLEATHHTRFVETLSPTVNVRIEVVVAEGVHAPARIYAGFELKPDGERRYSREVALPRGTGLLFRISDASGLMETDAAGEPVYRQLVADRELDLRYEVQGWRKGHSL